MIHEIFTILKRLYIYIKDTTNHKWYPYNSNVLECGQLVPTFHTEKQ